MDKIREFWYKLTNNMSLTSGVVALISATLVFTGFVFWQRQMNIELLFWYLGISGGLMVLYAIAYGVYAENTSEFNGGLISARQVMRFIAVITSAAFLLLGVQIQQVPNLDPSYEFFSLLGGPVVMTIFAITYCLYANGIHNDLRTSKVAVEAGDKGGPGRGTIKLLKFATCGTLLYCAVRAGLAGDSYMFLLNLVALICALLGCTAVEVCFQKTVTVARDRGFRD
jgi:hypothetical protein